MSRNKLDVQNLGQVFTPEDIVSLMIGLRQRHGRVLEPSCGDGAFSRRIEGCDAIELDSRVAPPGARVMDFFDLSLDEKYMTCIGNPPYVRHQDIPPSTRALLDGSMFDGRSNLALFFIHKAVQHLDQGGELIFIVPREFIKLTAARKLNAWLSEQGTITHWIETGDTRIFAGAVPNCAIFRFELGDFSGRTLYRTLDSEWGERAFVERYGQITFPREIMSVPMSALFDVKVGAVSGADDVFAHETGTEFVCSKTIDSGKTRRMLYNVQHPSLVPHRERLLARRVRRFDTSNWWTWGRAYHDAPGVHRIYVNGRTRRPNPFFTHPCETYDGSILALFPKVEGMDIQRAIELLNNAVPWADLGFIVDGRFVFSQRTLQTLMLPPVFNELRLPRQVAKAKNKAPAKTVNKRKKVAA
ncbi:MAG: class I SAM-dependent methyltransferase [Rhodocyclaceae bacterium]